MKVFLLKIVLFTVLVFGICFGLGEIKFSDEFLIKKTKGTAYDKVGWNLQMINNEQQKISNSIIFFGSSYVLGGINDSILQDNDIKAHNFAIRHNGNEISLYFLKRIAPLKPKSVVFLKGKRNFRYLHKLTPLLYTPSDLIAEGQTFNFSVITYLFKRTKLVLEYLSNELAEGNKAVYFSHKEYGIRYDEIAMSIEEYNSENTIKSLAIEQERFNIYKNGFLFVSEKNNPSFWNRFLVLKRKLILKYYSQNNFINNDRSQENFINSARNICNENGIEFLKIYVPAASDVRPFNNYEGEYFMPAPTDSSNVLYLEDYSFLNNYRFWSDRHHLNKIGSIEFTKRLLEENKFFNK